MLGLVLTHLKTFGLKTEFCGLQEIVICVRKMNSVLSFLGQRKLFCLC